MNLPYLPPGREILYVPIAHPHMQAAKTVAETQSLDPDHPTGAVVALDNEIIGQGANGSHFHKKNGCERKKRNIPTGQGYELCEGCHPKNHAEQKAIANAREGDKREERIDIQPNHKSKITNHISLDIYLWGHWWCCQSCWAKMIEFGINNVYLPEGAEQMFRKH